LRSGIGVLVPSVFYPRQQLLHVGLVCMALEVGGQVFGGIGKQRFAHKAHRTGSAFDIQQHMAHGWGDALVGGFEEAFSPGLLQQKFQDL